MVPVYYCPDHPYNNISSVSLKFYVGFQKVTSETLEHCEFFDPQGRSWRSPYHNQNNIDYIQIEIFKANRNIVVPTVCALSQQNISQIIQQYFGQVYNATLKRMSRKGIM